MRKKWEKSPWWHHTSAPSAEAFLRSYLLMGLTTYWRMRKWRRTFFNLGVEKQTFWIPRYKFTWRDINLDFLQGCFLNFQNYFTFAIRTKTKHLSLMIKKVGFCQPTFTKIELHGSSSWCPSSFQSSLMLNEFLPQHVLDQWLPAAMPTCFADKQTWIARIKSGN